MERCWSLKETVAIGEAADKGAPDQGINRGILDDFCRSKQAAEQAADDTIGETIQQAKANASPNGKVQRGTEHRAPLSKEDEQQQRLRKKGEELRRQEEEKNQM